MLIPRRRTMEMFSISALDLFASALGTFVLLAILLFPFYLREPSLETELQGAQAELAAAGESLHEAERTAEATARRKAQAMAALAEARARLQEAQAAAAAAAADLERIPATAEQQQPSTDQQNALSINDLDLVFVMDTTGSMRNELADVQANLLGVIRVLARLAPSLRVGFVAFKDRGEAYLTLTFPLSPMNPSNVAEVVQFVGRMSADGGGDDPEPVDEALAVATAMPWRDDAQGRIIVIGDAPARPSGRQQALGHAARFNSSTPDLDHPRTVSAIFTGESPVAGRFFEQLAGAGGGDFSAYEGQIIENVLLSVLSDPSQQASGRAG